MPKRHDPARDEHRRMQARFNFVANRSCLGCLLFFVLPAVALVVWLANR